MQMLKKNNHFKLIVLKSQDYTHIMLLILIFMYYLSFTEINIFFRKMRILMTHERNVSLDKTRFPAYFLQQYQCYTKI